MKNSYLVITAFLVSIFLLYALVFIYNFFNFNNEFKFSFESLENLNFHEKYSKKIHHIREESHLRELHKKPKVEDLLFTTINEIENKKKIVLFQGDSCMEQLNNQDENLVSLNLVKKFGDKKKSRFN